jgi:hypothetical protein
LDRPKRLDESNIACAGWVAGENGNQQNEQAGTPGEVIEALYGR